MHLKLCSSFPGTRTLLVPSSIQEIHNSLIDSENHIRDTKSHVSLVRSDPTSDLPGSLGLDMDATNQVSSDDRFLFKFGCNVQLATVKTDMGNQDRGQLSLDCRVDFC